MARLYIGTSGYHYRDWRGRLYPEGLPIKRWLARYAEVFSTVELNATFYRLPTPAAVENWRDQTPADFVFACKGSRYLTHLKRLDDVDEGLGRYFERVSRLGAKLRVVLWQLPPQMNRPDPERLDRFLGRLPREMRHAVEFRHEAWYSETICRVLDGHGAALCEHDLLGRPPPRPTGGFRYLRFHGTLSRYAGGYGEAALRPVARSLSRWRESGGDAYVYFNNDLAGHAVRDALVLARLVDRGVSSIGAGALARAPSEEE